MYPKASKRELIDFKIGPGDRSRYDVVTVADDTAIFRNKIVLIGTMSDRSENDEHLSTEWPFRPGKTRHVRG